jgi:hypothetical protein
MNAGRRVVWGAAALAAVAVIATGIAVASGSGLGAEDDLAVVKRAVAQSTQVVPDTPAATRAEDPAPRREAAPRRAAGKEPTWLKVRVTEKGTSRKKVTVNLPLALVRVLDDGDFPIDFGCGGDDHRHRRCSIKLAEILDTLESGQDLVEVDDDEQLVRIWVE